jgi:asparagine synthase (glutamine-hydrolysing)
MHQDEPIADPACLPMYFVSKAAHESGVKVVLVGEGSDEVFGGYTDFVHSIAVQKGRWRQLCSLPRPVRSAIYHGARLMGRKDGLVDVLRRAANDEPLYWGLTIAFWETEKRRLLSPHVHLHEEGRGAAALVRGYYEEVLAGQPGADLLQQMSYVELQNRLPELLLMRVDKFAMAHSLEARAPFLDYHLTAYALSLPSRMKVAGTRTKHILKEAVAGILPADVIDRTKQGFRVPLPAWLAGELMPWAKEQLFDSSMRRLGLFDERYIQWMWDRHRDGVWDHSFDLWCLINLSAWYEHWFCE